ncbi:FkbM family methyltransferase [Variovorax paradoxus]|uniref:FkbM family methyltransferase n=1 Tax=Variovorax paradoxus TaxID=34073 RepID=UPI00277E8625|nr:FkbM family methyltransferase [Variovorax paradoxus]MDP9932689.1 FkbM family methyltransferase [Variovorax paradoxus]
MPFISHAQNFEDVMLWRALGGVQNGFFIDVGAWSPDLHSVTKSFSERGWRGINIEPNPFYFAQITEKRPLETNLRVAVGNRVGQISMNFIEDTGLSTADQGIARAHTNAGWSARQEEVEITTLSEIWKKNVPVGTAVHFLKIDVEGLERAVIEGNNWKVNRPWVVVIESTLPLSQIESHQQWESLLTEAEYVHCYSDGLNRFYIAAEHSELVDKFRFPPNVFDGFTLAEVKREKERVQNCEADLDLTAGKLRLAADKLRIAEARLVSAQAIATIAENRRAEAEKHEEEIQKTAKSQLIALRSELHSVNESKNAQVAAANGQAALAEHRYIAIQNSTMWRSTAPVRKLTGMLTGTARARVRRAAKAVWWLLTPALIPQRLKFIRDRKTILVEQGATQQPEGTSQAYATSPTSEYARWILEVERWSNARPLPSESFPIVTFVVTGITPVESLLRTVGSIQAQVHQGWEVVLCGAFLTEEPNSAAHQLVSCDSRIRLATTESDDKASSLSAGLMLARGKFIAILDCGDILAPAALNEFSVELNRFPDAEIFYSDEDQQSSMQSRERPLFKPEWSPELLYSFNYFGRLVFLQRALIEKVGGIDTTSGSAVEWDLNLRTSDLAQNIRRIPKVLCHIKAGGDRGRGLSIEDAAENRKAIEKFWAAKGVSIAARTQENGTQHIQWLPSKFPKVSIIIPTKDKSHLLRMCMNGLLFGTDYPNKEIVIVDTGSKEPETFSYYQELAAHSDVKIVNFERIFNYSAACNYGASCAEGEMLLFLNNDIECISPAWLKEMVGFAVRPGVGVVGTKLIYPSLELQHGGVGIGPHLCALMYRSGGGQSWDIYGTPDHPRNWLAIMGACQLVRRDVFELIGKFDESYLIAMSDVALCLRAWQAGYRTAYAPSACLVHHEGATRGNSNPVKDVRRIADDIRAIGIDEDPYLHPELSGSHPIPKLKLAGESNPRQVLEDQVRDCGSILAFNPKLNLTNEGACIQVAGLPRSAVLWTPQAVHLVSDKWSAARWCMDLLRSRRELRVRFPDALSAGTGGAFYRWIREEAKFKFQLPATFDNAIESLFLEDISARARQLFLFREDVRQAIPHGLTPAGQTELFRWYMRNGRAEGDLRLEEIWWLFWLAAENPARELVQAYRFTPAWQSLYPDALTIFGRSDFSAWFSATYNAADSWVDPSQWAIDLSPEQHLRSAYNARHQWRTLHPRAFENEKDAHALIDWLSAHEGISTEARVWCSSLNRQETVAEMIAPGVNIIGHFCYPSGLRVSVEALEGALKSASVHTSLRDIRTDKRDDPMRWKFNGLEYYGVTLIHTQPEPFFNEAYKRSDLAQQSFKPYRIAYWYWEFDSVPESWISAAGQVDEVWTATEFVAKGLRDRLSIPVRTLFPGVKLGHYLPRKREFFGLSQDNYTFLFTFHMMSVMERKNPLGLIQAFKRAFKSSEPATLVLKTSFGDRHPAQILELQEAAAGANIKIIDQVFSSDEVLSLMDACDAYVSLHRSEGLGLTMAEAMLMGKPVIATNYSGNIDFMDESNSLLVPFKLQKLGRPIPPYDANSEWAEPSIECAANYMRRLYEDREWAAGLGARAKVSAEKSLSLDVAGLRLAERIKEIRASEIYWK